MSGVICVKGLKLFGKHGVFAPERENGQAFIIDVECRLDIAEAAVGDAYAKTVCLNQICHAISDVSKQGPYNLIETFADKIADGLLAKFPTISAVDAVVYKPDAPVDFEITHTCVRVSRRRAYRVALGLGSNVGDKLANLQRAIGYLKTTLDLRIDRVSSFYQSAPHGPIVQDDFVNMCVVGQTYLEPHALLDVVKRLELDMGRTPSAHWGPREIDIDILCHGHCALETQDLTLPHPQMFNRAFVLIPLAEIAGDWVISGSNVSEHLSTNSAQDGHCKAVFLYESEDSGS